MVVIKSVDAKSILDSRKEKTISVSIKTEIGTFSSSSPTGKSTGKFEKKPYRRKIEGDIENLKKLSDYFSDTIIEKFGDLRKIEDVVDGHVGANTLFALESSILKAIAKEQEKEIWQLININGELKFPRLIGNCIGGGKHSELVKGRRPDFQEFLLIPDFNSVKNSLEKNISTKKKVELILKERDENFKSKRNDEDAWMTSLNEKSILDVLSETEIPLGVDIAASGFYKRKKYQYKNPLLKRTPEEQLNYLNNLIHNSKLFYIEDPFNEEDFDSFSELLKKNPNSLIVGDDLTTTNSKRFKEAITNKSINAIIVKPNQCGSLLEVKTVCELAKENNIKIVFSHRSGETMETILADLAFGFQADFFKCGITGKEREVKLKRLIDIENSLK